MKMSLRRRIAAVILFAGLVVLVFTVSLAHAQGSTDLTPTPTLTPTLTPTPTTVVGGTVDETTGGGTVDETTPKTAGETTRLPPALNAGELLWVMVITFGFALLAWGILFYYTNGIQQRFYTVFEALARLRVNVNTLVTGKNELSQSFGDSSTGAGGRIEGPDVVTIAMLSSEFKALDPNGKPVTVTWAADPPSAAMVTQDGPTTKVFPAIAGVFTLNATDTTSSTPVTFPPKQVAAVAQQANTLQLPFYGQGYGAIAIAIVLFAVIVILGLSSVLPTAAIAPLLGTLVGYIFGVSQTEAKNKSQTGGGETPTA